MLNNPDLASPEFTVLVCGDRNWTNRAAIERRLRLLPSGTTIIHGAARGADTIAGEVAASLGFAVHAFPADWARYGRAAGPIRNRYMLRNHHPDLVIAFHNSIATSKGTRDCINEASRLRIEVELQTERGLAR